MTLLPTLVAALVLLAIRARVERRQQRAYDVRAGDHEAAIFRDYKTLMYPDAESLAKRETDWYINRLDAATLSRPTEMEAI